MKNIFIPQNESLCALAKKNPGKVSCKFCSEIQIEPSELKSAENSAILFSIFAIFPHTIALNGTRNQK